MQWQCLYRDLRAIGFVFRGWFFWYYQLIVDLNTYITWLSSFSMSSYICNIAKIASHSKPIQLVYLLSRKIISIIKMGEPSKLQWSYLFWSSRSLVIQQIKSFDFFYFLIPGECTNHAIPSQSQKTSYCEKTNHINIYLKYKKHKAFFFLSNFTTPNYMTLLSDRMDPLLLQFCHDLV